MLHYRTKLEITAESVEDAENDFARFPAALVCSAIVFS